MLGVLVARVTGQSFETFPRERIFDPLGMKDTGFHMPAGKIDRLPTRYAPDPQTGEFVVEDKAEGEHQGQHGGPGFGMAVRTYRGGFAPIGQFGWDGGAGTTTYADPDNQLVGILLTQTGMSTPDSARAIHDFWTTLYQAIDD